MKSLAVLLLLVTGCIRPPDRVIIGYQRDLDSDDQKMSAALSFPITYTHDYRPIFESPTR